MALFVIGQIIVSFACCFVCSFVGSDGSIFPPSAEPLPNWTKISHNSLGCGADQTILLYESIRGLPTVIKNNSRTACQQANLTGRSLYDRLGTGKCTYSSPGRVSRMTFFIEILFIGLVPLVIYLCMHFQSFSSKYGNDQRMLYRSIKFNFIMTRAVIAMH